jgi:hypothetical protein
MRSMSGEGALSIERFKSPHPSPLPNGERERTCARDLVRAGLIGLGAPL